MFTSNVPLFPNYLKINEFSFIFTHQAGSGQSPSAPAGQNANASSAVPSYPGAQQQMPGNYNQYAQYYAGATAAAGQGNYGAAQPYNAYGAGYPGQQAPSNPSQSQSNNDKK